MARIAHMHGACTKSPTGEDRLPQTAETNLLGDWPIACDRHASAVLSFQQHRVIFVQMTTPTDVQYHAPTQAPILAVCMNDYRPIACDGLGACVAQPSGE